MLFAYMVVAAAAVSVASGFSNGAPESACQDMVPKHPVDPQKSIPPYTITTSTKVVKAGQPVEVVITGKTPSDTVRGLLLMARQGDKVVGKFATPADNFGKLLNCGAPGSAVSHKKIEAKDVKRVLTYTWTAPPGFTGEIKFRATIALNGGVFWVGVESPKVLVKN